MPLQSAVNSTSITTPLRSETAPFTSEATTRAAEELQLLLTSLRDYVASLHTSPDHTPHHLGRNEGFEVQCDDLQRIRQLLIEDGHQKAVKTAFRCDGGFEVILDVLDTLKGHFDSSRLSRDDRIGFFQLIKSSLDVISVSIQGHSKNRSYFTSLGPRGGWVALESAILNTGISASNVLKSPSLPRHSEEPIDPEADVVPNSTRLDLGITIEAQSQNDVSISSRHRISEQSEHRDTELTKQSASILNESLEALFGILFAFAVGDEETKNLFRGIQKISDQAEWDNGARQTVFGNSPMISTSGDWALAEYIRKKLGKEVLHNPEIVPLILNIWSSCVGHDQDSNALVLGVLLALRMVQTSSERNEVALHNAHVLRPLITAYAAGLGSPKVQESLSLIIERLLDYGINNLQDAHLLFRESSKSEKISNLVLYALQASKMSSPFIQFDLSLHGYSSIDLPAIGRSFPPLSTNGYTIMAWVRFDSFDDRSHTTIFGASDATETCFVLLFLEQEDRQIVLQTSTKDSIKSSVRFRSTAFVENQWYHIAIVHRRPRTMGSSRATLFVNGTLTEQLKCQYPASPPTRSSSAESFASITGSPANIPTIQAFLGTPRSIAIREGRNMTLTRWSLALFHLFSDAVGDELLQVYHALGPRYIGNYQDSLGSFQTYRASSEVHLKNEQLHPSNPDKSELMAALKQQAGALIPENKIIISFSPTFTLDSDDQNQVNESRLIKNLPSDAASSLNRALRSDGSSIIINSAVTPISQAAIVSHGLGFLTGDPVISVPQSLDDACWRLCGTAPVILKLLDMARTKGEVIRAVQVIFACLDNNWRNCEAMEREHAYGVLAGLMREKLGFGSLLGDVALASTRAPPQPVDIRDREELALELLRMTLAFLGYSETHPENTLLINGLAYRFLLVNFDTWRRAPIATQKVYYSQFVHFAARGKFHKFNAKRLVLMRIVKRLIDALKAESFSADVFPDFLEAFSAVFRCSISADTLRSLALFITYALQESRANTGGVLGHTRNRASSINSPFKPPITLSSEVSKFEVGVQLLEVFTECLCEQGQTDVINKFATTVTNKWLLFLLAEQDPRIVVLATKILVRMLTVHGANYLKNFSEKTGGFAILKIRLKDWWSVPALWISLLALLFGVDVGRLDYNGDFNQFTLSEMFGKANGNVVHSDVLPVIAAMLETGLQSVVKEGQKPRNGSQVNVAIVRGHHSYEVTNNAEVLSTIIRFFSDLQLKSSSFRNFAASSNFVQELLFVLYPTIVTSDKVTPEMELNSRGSTLTFEGQDVMIRSNIAGEDQQPSIIRTNAQPPKDAATGSRPSRASFRRPSSFVLVSSQPSEAIPKARFNVGVVSNMNPGSMALRVGSSIVQNLLSVVTAVYLDQIIYRKEFPGFGLFLKVPPGFSEHQAYFKSYILSNTMSELSNTLRMQDQLLKEPRVITNIARYAVYMSEAIFEGWYLNGALHLLDFVGQVLEFLQRKDVAASKPVRLCSHAVTLMKRVFLKISLLHLSELDEVKDSESTTAFLDKMAYWQTVILESDSDDQYFLRLIFFLLYSRIISRVVSVRHAALNFWRMLLVQKPEEALQVLNYAAPSSQRFLASGFLKLGQLDNEHFMVWIEHHRADLDLLFLGSMTRNWDDFVVEENKKTDETSKTRMNKRRENLKLWQEAQFDAENHWRKHESATGHWNHNVHAAEKVKHQRAMQDQQDNLNFTASTLEKFQRVLRGPVALFDTDVKTKWRLDESEGQNRMRLRVIPDRYVPSGIYQPKRKSSEQYSRRSASVSFRENLTTSSTRTYVQEPDAVMPSRSRAESRASRLTAAGEDEFEIVDNPHLDETGEFEDKNRKVMRTLQRGDVVQQVFNIARIEGLEPVEGLLIIGKQCLYIIDHYFQRADGEVVGAWQAPSEERDAYLPLIAGHEIRIGRPKVAPGERTTRHWKWDEVMLISKRRFLQRDVAFEMFFTDGRNYLLTASSTQIRDKLHFTLLNRSPLLSNPTASLHPEDQWRLEALRNPEDTPQSFGSKFASVFNTSATTPATKRWLKGEISNFAYLMQINTFAGRTFNDLTQYPIFPWVLADYTSDELDLDNPKTFRDLSKPMGCQTPLRESRFRERYENIKEMSTDPPYHYGTHYSSAMTVTSYLIRLQPFVKSYLLIQGGSFDLADRLFSSIAKAWFSSSEQNEADVRELIPEFFYLPEFLTNSNHYDFGVTQGSKGINGKQDSLPEIVDDVVLPPWAKGDPTIFIQKHREALESPYVSAHLHEWIDLIFGFKQQGEAAIESTNVFHHLSYQGAKDLDTIADHRERLVAIQVIHHFGQTPRQIFVRHHPPREDHAGRIKDLNNILESLSRSHAPVFERNESVASLIWVATADQVLQQGPLSLRAPSKLDIIMKWGYADGSIRFFDGKKMLALYENFHLGPISAALFVDGQTLVTAGGDGVVTIWNVNMLANQVEVNQRESLFGHGWPITLLTGSKSLSTLLSVDTSGRVLLWDLNRNQFIRELHSATSSPYNDVQVTAACISAATGDIALCIHRSVYIYTLNGVLQLDAEVCDENDPDDRVTAVAWYEGLRGDWVRRILLLTGHQNGAVRVWYRSVANVSRTSKGYKYSLVCLRRLPPAGQQNIRDTNHSRDGVRHGQQSMRPGHIPPRSSVTKIKERGIVAKRGSAVTAILPRAEGIWVGDESGRVYEWTGDFKKD